MRMMQAERVGYLAVSLGYFKTLFSNSGKSTSSEVPEDVQRKMGLSEGLIRFSVGLDNNIEQSLMKVKILFDQPSYNLIKELCQRRALALSLIID